jgi:hypothetical protein
MKKTTHVASQFVVCIKNTGYPASLELHKIYRVIPDEDAAEDANIRVVDESGEDYLYPASYFAAINVSATVEKSLMTVIEDVPYERKMQRKKPSKGKKTRLLTDGGKGLRPGVCLDNDAALLDVMSD